MGITCSLTLMLLPNFKGPTSIPSAVLDERVLSASFFLEADHPFALILRFLFCQPFLFAIPGNPAYYYVLY